MDIHSVNTQGKRNTVISLVADFTDAPGGRTILQGEFSGEEFRTRLIEPALHDFETVTVDLDGALGLPASFLDEALGGYAGEVESGRLVIKLTDNAVAKVILEDCLKRNSVA